MEIPVYVFFPVILGVTQYLSMYVRFNSKLIRTLKTHYFNIDISSKKIDRATIHEILNRLEKNGRIRKINENSSVFTFVDNLFFMKSNIYFIPKDSTKLYYRGLNRIYRINKKSKDKVFNEITEVLKM